MRSSSSTETETQAESGFNIESLPDVTVKEYLENYTREVENSIMNKAEKLKLQLREHFEKQKTLLITEAKRLKESSEGSPNTSVKLVDIEINDLSGREETKTVTMRVGGPQSLVVQIGRSNTAQFLKKKNISLAFDDEVSTTHGQFTIRSGKLHYQDLLATNGSRVFPKGQPGYRIGRKVAIKGEDLKHKGIFEAFLDAGDYILVGQCKLSIIKMTDEPSKD
jgi:hypothetical protein